MRLAIADPPYLGRGRRWYSDDDGRPPTGLKGIPGHTGTPRKADHHEDAHLWNDPQTHCDLVRRLMTEFDGWAIAAARDSLRVYLEACPAAVHVAVYHVRDAWPPGGAIHSSWEPVLVWVPLARRNAVGRLRPRDVFSAAHPKSGFCGAKPRAWTRWVLDMLGYQDGDEVVDLFPGSGAVSNEIRQQVLPL